jgi:starvation-inducible DNA-binding protein
MLYLKTQNYHWNITGIHFISLHHLFEEQYGALAKANDEIAERIVTLGDRAPASFAEFLEFSILEETPDTVGASEMLRSLLHDHEAIAGLCHEIIDFAEEHHDHVSHDLVADRLAEHEKTAWMLRATLS